MKLSFDDIKDIIKTKDIWNSVELIDVLTKSEVSTIEISFCHIGGYECMADGTQTEVCNSLEEVQELLDSNHIKYDKTITDPVELAKSIEDEWTETHDGGGDSGWIEY